MTDLIILNQLKYLNELSLRYTEGVSAIGTDFSNIVGNLRLRKLDLSGSDMNS
jgi:hypothetical protein